MNGAQPSGTEALDLTDANEKPEGLQINRRKGSRDNIVAWTPRLTEVWQAAKARRDVIVADRKIAVGIRPEQRPHFLADRGGGRITKSGFDTAWQRLIHAALDGGIITEAERFSPHDLKRKSVTDAAGTRAEKKEASGHKSDAMLDVYDMQIQAVKPAGKAE